MRAEAPDQGEIDEARRRRFPRVDVGGEDYKVAKEREDEAILENLVEGLNEDE